MNITIHRGTDQIGGSVTEYEHNGYRLFVDFGEQLPGYKHSTLSNIEGLTTGDLSKSALLITHYHGDHIGNIKELPKDLPIYMGELGRDIQLSLSEYLSFVDNEQNIMIERLKETRSFKPGIPFTIGTFRIMPVAVDHSAFDAYAFRIEADGTSVFHTGDFRTHGFRSGKMDEVLTKYVGKVDYVVCEGTNVSRPDATSITERELQKDFETKLERKAGHIVYMSSTNIDRLFAFYHAALKVGVPFIVDAYQKKIMDIVVNKESLWGKARLYQYGKYSPIVLQREYREFRATDGFKEVLEKKGYVLIARANERFDHLIAQLPGEKVNYLSMWKGYLDKNNVAYNKTLALSIGDTYEYLHTSGHVDMQSLTHLFDTLQPQGIIPIHTDNPDDFEKTFGQTWNILRLKDGVSVNIPCKLSNPQ